VFVVFGVLMVATLVFALGVRARPAAVVMLLPIFYLRGMRASVAGDVHHRYLISVKFPFLPVVFPVFFDLSRLSAWWWARRRHAPHAAG